MKNSEIKKMAEDYFFSNTKDKSAGERWPTMVQMLTEFGEYLLKKSKKEKTK